VRENLRRRCPLSNRFYPVISDGLSYSTFTTSLRVANEQQENAPAPMVVNEAMNAGSLTVAALYHVAIL
jgi:hypothetical protein